MVSPERTLCARCREDYKTAGFFLVPAPYETVKSPCDICNRPGFTYVLTKKRRDKT